MHLIGREVRKLDVRANLVEDLIGVQDSLARHGVVGPQSPVRSGALAHESSVESVGEVGGHPVHGVPEGGHHLLQLQERTFGDDQVGLRHGVCAREEEVHQLQPIILLRMLQLLNLVQTTAGTHACKSTSK